MKHIKTQKMCSECLLRLGSCCSKCVFMYGAFCRGALKTDMSSLFITSFNISSIYIKTKKTYLSCNKK